MNIRDLRKERMGYRKDVYFYFTIFLTFSLLVFFAQNFIPPSEFLNGLFVPDVVNMSGTLDNIRIGAAPLFSSNIIGIYYIYLAAWLTHPALSLLINLIFIYYSFKFIYDIFVLNNIASRIVCLGIILNPYLYLAVTGPNKEIPLLFGTLYVVRSLIFKQNFWFVKSAFFSIAIIFIRDGYGAILLLTTFLFSIKMPVNFLWKVGVSISVFASFAYELILSNIPIISRNMLLANSLYKDVGNDSAFVGDFLTSSANPLYSIIKLIVRMIYNWLTLSMFPVLYTPNNSIYFLGFAYWIFGILISIGIFACIYAVFSNNSIDLIGKQKKMIAGLVIFIWSTTSVSLFIQPRYLMPILPLAFGILLSLKKARRKLITTLLILFSCLTILIYSLSGNPPAKLKDLTPTKSSFLINIS